MASPQHPENSEPDFNAAIAEVEEQLTALKARYRQVETDRERKEQLQERRDEIKGMPAQTPQLQAELKQIKEQLDTVEVNLESQLFSWSGIKQPFWQAVRFLGLGIVLGWFMKSWSG